MKTFTQVIALTALFISLLFAASQVFADTSKQVAPPPVSDPYAYREITTDNGVIIEQIEIYDDGAGNITYRRYDGVNTETRAATANEITLYENGFKSDAQRLEWLQTFVDELNECSDNMAIAETSWVGWGANARDTAMVETFRCLKIAYNKDAKAWNALGKVLVANGVDITP